MHQIRMNRKLPPSGIGHQPQCSLTSTHNFQRYEDNGTQMS